MTTTSIIIPRVTRPQGLIASAKTYRLVFNEEGLHIIHLGRAMGMKAKSGSSLADSMAAKIASKYERHLTSELATAEEEIANIPLSALVRRKGSFWISLSEPGAVTAKLKEGRPPQLHINGRAGKAKLIGTAENATDFEEIALAFSRQ